jgi:riboflavin biosynthesis pyrimidine reductase
MRALFWNDSDRPAPAALAASEITDSQLADWYRPPPQPWVRANMVCSVDGAASGPSGVSGDVQSEADHAVYHLLRALCDVVLVGAGTARAEPYGAPRVHPRWAAARAATGRPRPPVLAVATRTGRLPDRLADLAPAAEGRLVLLTCAAAGEAVLTAWRGRLGGDQVLVTGDDDVDLGAALTALTARGWNQVLCEGGPRLLGDLLRSGRLDELCLSLTPRLAAGGFPRIVGGPGASVGLTLAALVEGQGTLLGRWLTRPGSR